MVDDTENRAQGNVKGYTGDDREQNLTLETSAFNSLMDVRGHQHTKTERDAAAHRHGTDPGWTNRRGTGRTRTG